MTTYHSEIPSAARCARRNIARLLWRRNLPRSGRPAATAARIGLAVLIVVLNDSSATVMGHVTAAPSAPTHGARGAPIALQAPLPLAFEPNRGQGGPSAPFLARGPGYTVAFSATGATVTLQRRVLPTTTPSSSPHRHGERHPEQAGQVSVTMSLVGANHVARAQGQRPLSGTVSYLLGRDRRGWLTNIPTYATVRFAAVYRGIDLVYYGKGPRLEFDFHVAPGADTRQIRLAFRGGDHPALTANGDLVLHTRAGEIRQRRPYSYQLVHGTRRHIDCSYVHVGAVFGIRVGRYDQRAPLVIDPVVVYSTYYGSSGADRGNGVAVDGQGNLYVVGTTSAYGAQAAFVSKFDPTGLHVLWTQIISNRSPNKPTCNAQGNGIAIDGRGNVEITGAFDDVGSFSWNNNLCQNEGVLWASFDPSGTAVGEMVYSAGGTINENRGTAIAVDGQGNSYITGQTDRRPDSFPITPGAFQTTAGIDKASSGVAGDAFVLKVDPTGAVVYGTYLGGSSIDAGLSIAVDGNGDAVVGGTTQSGNFPATATAYQPTMSNTVVNAFVSELSADGSALLYSTFLGGANGASANGVAVDGRGAIDVIGTTNAPDFPTTPNAYSRSCGGNGTCTATESCSYDWSSEVNECHVYSPEDAFVLTIDPTQAGSASLVYSTFLGGLNRDLATSIALAADGEVYVAGRTASSNFPVRDAAQPALGGAWNSFVAKVNPAASGAASLVWSTYLGGSGYDEADGLALDANGNVYVTGFTTSSDFPTRNPAQDVNNGNADAFVAKLSPAVSDPGAISSPVPSTATAPAALSTDAPTQSPTSSPVPSTATAPAALSTDVPTQRPISPPTTMATPTSIPVPTSAETATPVNTSTPTATATASMAAGFTSTSSPAATAPPTSTQTPRPRDPSTAVPAVGTSTSQPDHTPVTAATQTATTVHAVTVSVNRPRIKGGRTRACSLKKKLPTLEPGCELITTISAPGATVVYTIVYPGVRGLRQSYTDRADSRGHSLRVFNVPYLPPAGSRAGSATIARVTVAATLTDGAAMQRGTARFVVTR